MSPAKSCAEVLTPSTTECDLLWKWGHCGLVSEDELSGVGATPVWMVLPAEERPCEKEAEPGVRCLQAKEQVGLPGARAEKEGACPRASGGGTALPTPGFWPSSPSVCGAVNSTVVSTFGRL